MESSRIPTESVYPWTPPAGGGALVAATVAIALFTTVVFLAMVTVAGADTGYPMPEGALPAIALGVIAVTGLAALAVLRFHEISPWIRTLVVLAAAHAALAVAALALWRLSAARVAFWHDTYPIASWLPAPAVAFALSVLVVIAAALRSPRRAGTPRWLQAVAAWALTFLLGVGLWLPIYADLGDARVIGAHGAASTRLIATALLVPALAATLAALIAARRPRWRRLAAVAGLGVGSVLLLVALGARAQLDREEAAVYANFVPVLFGAAWFALATIVAVALTHVRALRVAARDRKRPAPWRQEGVVAVKTPSSTTVGHLVNHGWLAGLESESRGFILRTRNGELAIPAGAAIIAPVPPWTAQAPLGTAVPVISEGDRVEISGFIAASGVEPYRTSPRPIAGTAGLVITPARRLDEPVARDLVLQVWRPCAAFLLAIMLAALPGLYGMLIVAGAE